MIIKFPFVISQLDENTVEIDMDNPDYPIVSIHINPQLASLIEGKVIDKLYEDAYAAVIRACVTVES